MLLPSSRGAVLYAPLTPRGFGFRLKAHNSALRVCLHPCSDAPGVGTLGKFSPCFPNLFLVSASLHSFTLAGMNYYSPLLKIRYSPFTCLDFDYSPSFSLRASMM